MSMKKTALISLHLLLVSTAFGHLGNHRDSLEVDIERLFQDVEMIAVVEPNHMRRFILEIDEIIYVRPGCRIQPLKYDGKRYLDRRTEPYSPNNSEAYTSPIAINGYKYLAFLRRVEGEVFDEGFMFTESRRFSLEETVQVLLGQDGFIVLTDRKNLQESGLVEIYMSSINGEWEEHQPEGWKNTFINNQISRVEAFESENGQQILEAVKNYISLANAKERGVRERIFKNNANNPAFIKIFLSTQNAAHWNILDH